MRPRQWVTYLGYRAVWAGAAAMPEPLAWRLPGPAGRAWYRLGSARQREQVRRNLARAAGHPPRAELERLVRAAYRDYARYWVEAFRAHRMDPSDVLARSTSEGLEWLDAMRDSGRGGILATAHLGSWDIGAIFSVQRRWQMAAVAEVVEPRALYDRFVRLRREVGIEVIPLVRGGPMLERLEEVIRGGGIAVLLADRDLTRSGPVVDFFGEPCRLPPGVAVLARRTGAPVVAGAFLTTPTGWHGAVRPPVDLAGLDVAAGTQVVAHELEHLIRRAPEQWHVFVPNWLADREPDHAAVRAAGSRR